MCSFCLSSSYSASSGAQVLMQAKAFKSACSCNPGFQVGCRFRAQLPQAIHTISAPSGSTVKIGFQIPVSVCIIVSRGREKGKRGRREQGRCTDLEDTIRTSASIQNKKLSPILLPLYYCCLCSMFYSAYPALSYDSSKCTCAHVLSTAK